MYQAFKKYYLIIACLIFSSCNTYKTIPYFQDLKLKGSAKEAIDNATQVTIQPHDILGIFISAAEPKSAAPYNNNLARMNGNASDNTPDNPLNPIIGYLVDNDGTIMFPSLGKLKVSGLTTAALRDQLTKQLMPNYLKDATVSVRIINFKISVLGDVQRPNVYPVQNERITILEALSLAGDLNITANRKNVLLIREQNGNREYVNIDLTSKALFTSPYYYLKSNDQIYVDPNRAKYGLVDLGARNLTIIISALSVVAIVFSTLHR
ncbi:polysaccharide biosynthesis/export family protein [Mucilaginibacter sp. HMF5004]|uniref:polysaccharide biosynthesis/export family protein n=1 Tax=Mucilaginibacter rivuli TaxID=2857527 RepID=UPI001C605691|nr:polysaccharide biosynthesis/export family protein [Mucilaginibacter rivuli]MBW4890065.1 polysaccharide biosynthesis/export family protein [Mucilaginibacter rivuli]